MRPRNVCIDSALLNRSTYALTAPLLDVDQAVPLLRRRQQALAEERQLAGEDRQLARPGVLQGPRDPQQVAQVEQLSQFPALFADLLLADHDLDLAGPVANLEEVDVPLHPAQHDPPGDADFRPGFRAVRRRRFKLADITDGPVVVEPMAPRVKPQLGDLREFLPADRLQVLTLLRLGLTRWRLRRGRIG